MKKCISLISVVMLMLILSGCPSLLGSDFRSEQLSNDNLSETEAIEEMEALLIHAIETEDRELLKSAFSEKALSLAGDIDTGIDYIFDLFEGDIICVDARNHSSLDYAETDGKTHKIDAECSIKTTSDTYRLSYIFYSVQELEPAAEGVYVLRLQKDGELKDFDGYLYRIAGIDYPERMIVHKTANEITTCLNNKDYDGLKSLFSEQALSACDDFDTGAAHLWDSYTGFKMIGFQDSWMETEALEGVVRYHVFLDLNISKNGRRLLYFCFDVSRDGSKDGIYRLKLTKIASGDTLDAYDNLGDAYEKSGIYYPSWDMH